MVRRLWAAVILAVFLAWGCGQGGLVAAQSAPHHQHLSLHTSAQRQSAFNGLVIALAAPDAPQSLVVNPNGTTIRLTWKAVPGAATYSIYRGPSARGEGTTPYITGITSPGFTNTKVVKGTVYYYQVTAVNSAGESARSNEVFAAPEGIPVPVATPTPSPPSQPNNVGAILGWLLGLLLLTLVAVGGIIFLRRRGVTDEAPPPPSQPSLQPSDSIPARGLFDPPTTPIRNPLNFPEQGDTGDTTVMVPADQRQLAPLSAAPIWPSAPHRTGGAFGEPPPSSASVGLIVAIILIALGVLGIGLFAYFAATAGASSGARATLPTATSTTVASATFTATPLSAPIIAVNAGGDAVGSFTADMNMQGGATSTTANPIDMSGVNNAAPMAVYQTERWGIFSYVFANLAPGSSYIVRLHFAETYFTTPGQRMFNVSINDTSVLSNFDIIAAAGAPNRAVVKEFPVNATVDGTITMHFSDGSANHAKISGIELIPNG